MEVGYDRACPRKLRLGSTYVVLTRKKILYPWQRPGYEITPHPPTPWGVSVTYTHEWSLKHKERHDSKDA